LWGNWDTHPTGVSTTTDGHRLATETYALRSGEAVYGFGEQPGRLDKVGQTIDLDMVEAMGTTTPRAYKNIPFFWTTRGYGLFWHTTARATAWVGSRNAADIQVAIEDDHLDQYVFVGDPRTILDRYTTLTGKAHVPPRWSFGWWQSKISYSSAAEALDVVRRYRDQGLPIDVLHLDTHWYAEDWRCDLEFDAERFPDPAAFLAEMGELGVKVSLWQLPYIPEGSALFDELDAVGGFVGHPDGGLYDIGLCYSPSFTGRVGCIDFTNPEGVAVYQRHLRHLHELGAAAIKADFGEEAPADGVYHDGTPGHLAHHLYPRLYNRAVAEATHEATDEWIIWARSAWAGSHRYPLHWGGDSSNGSAPAVIEEELDHQPVGVERAFGRGLRAGVTRPLVAAVVDHVQLDGSTIGAPGVREVLDVRHDGRRRRVGPAPVVAGEGRERGLDRRARRQRDRFAREAVAAVSFIGGAAVEGHEGIAAPVEADERGGRVGGAPGREVQLGNRADRGEGAGEGARHGGGEHPTVGEPGDEHGVAIDAPLLLERLQDRRDELDVAGPRVLRRVTIGRGLGGHHQHTGGGRLVVELEVGDLLLGVTAAPVEVEDERRRSGAVVARRDRQDVRALDVPGRDRLQLVARRDRLRRPARPAGHRLGRDGRRRGGRRRRPRRAGAGHHDKRRERHERSGHLDRSPGVVVGAPRRTVGADHEPDTTDLPGQSRGTGGRVRRAPWP
jgi:hypothetical protein